MLDMNWASSETVKILAFLLPGFVAAAVFYSLTSHPKPSQFERVVQALVFTAIVQGLALLISGNANLGSGASRSDRRRFGLCPCVKPRLGSLGSPADPRYERKFTSLRMVLDLLTEPRLRRSASGRSASPLRLACRMAESFGRGTFPHPGARMASGGWQREGRRNSRYPDSGYRRQDGRFHGFQLRSKSWHENQYCHRVTAPKSFRRGSADDRPGEGRHPHRRRRHRHPRRVRHLLQARQTGKAAAPPKIMANEKTPPPPPPRPSGDFREFQKGETPKPARLTKPPPPPPPPPPPKK